MTDTFTLILVLAGAAALLFLLQTFLAIRHDAVASAAGPMRTVEELQAQYEMKLAEKAQLDERIREREAALTDVAENQAKAEAVKRRLEELEIEWARKQDMRDELTALQGEVDAKVGEHTAVTSELKEAEEKLATHREKLAKLDGIEARLAAGAEALQALEGALNEKRDALKLLEQADEKLKEAQSALSEAKAEEEAARSRTARLEEDIAARARDLEAAEAELQRKEEARAKVSDALETLRAEQAALNLDLSPLREEEAGLNARIAALKSRIEEMKSQAEGAGGSAQGGDGADPLRDLLTIPAVLSTLQDLPDSTAADEADALRRVKARLAGQGLVYHDRQVHAFHTAMKVNESTQMAVLAGISGTGKSQLPRQYAAAMGIGLLQVPVQPRWDSPQDLMGFYNYIEGRYRPTDLAQALWHMDAVNRPDTPFGDSMLLVLLDEMNLARVEYYFSDFLSRLESRPSAAEVGDARLRKDAEIELEILMKDGTGAPRIFPGYNLLFAGTMNEDESTQTLSDKVVDRANVLRFPAPKTFAAGVRPHASPAAPEALSRRRWARWVQPGLPSGDVSTVDEEIVRLADVMRGMHRPFGHRLEKAMKHYVANYSPVDGGDRIRDALADQVEMRLLPKLRGVEVEQLRGPFEDLQKLVHERLGDEPLATAIEASVAQSMAESGRFTWSGVSR
ncbi:chromosome segregation ATPase-like protein [Rhodovulum sp. DZ06]|uniref:McrB family protein n=1 Tax=Rhodovulum sp. DZ06 TaxID=3425126 RepID=UPI003D336F09